MVYWKGGIEVHKLFFEWVEKTHGKRETFIFDQPLKEYGFGISMNRPDVISTTSQKIWELKPITHVSNAQKDIEQLKKYLNEMKEKGYRLGEPTELVPYKPGGIPIGKIIGVMGREFEVKIYPGKEKGLIYYALEPTGRNVIREFFEEFKRALEKGYDPMKKGSVPIPLLPTPIPIPIPTPVP